MTATDSLVGPPLLELSIADERTAAFATEIHEDIREFVPTKVI